MDEFEWPEEVGSAKLIESSRDGLRFRVTEVKSESNQSSSGAPRLEAQDLQKFLVDLSAEKQSILGWGGALTDATGLNIASLPRDLAGKLVESYFGPSGNNYNLVRVPIGGSDFSARAYSYDDTNGNEEDPYLLNWALAEEDLKLKIPLLKLAQQFVESGGERLLAFGSPWSPPKWMKENKSFIRGHLKHNKPTYEAYANYLVKFYLAYKEAGIGFWGGTVQNEPAQAFGQDYFFNSLQMSAGEQVEFVADFFGPILAENGFTKDNFKLMIGDDSLKMVNDLVADILSSSKARSYVSGVAFHWYASGYDAGYEYVDKLVEQSFAYNNMSANSSDKQVEFVLMTEACAGFRRWQRALDLGRWSRAEEYANDIIEDLKRGAAGWVDWNMALDLEAGPNWADNHCDSPVIVNKEKREFYKQPMYYALGHFSRFMRPNSVVVGLRRNTQDARLKAISAVKKDSKHVILNLLNESREAKKVQVGRLGGGHKFTFTLQPNSINTVVWKY